MCSQNFPSYLANQWVFVPTQLITAEDITLKNWSEIIYTLQLGTVVFKQTLFKQEYIVHFLGTIFSC